VETQNEVGSSLMDVKGVSALTGLSIGTIYHWVSQKRIPIVRFSARCVRFRRSDIDKWIASRVVAPIEEGRFVRDRDGQRRSTRKQSSCNE